MEYSFYDFLKLLGSLALFLYGMKIMSEGLQKFAGDRLRKILTAMTTNRVTGVLTGVLITALIQSSSATTVMVVSFVNAGLLTLSQSIGVIMGANIGTTVTAWIISALGFKVDIAAMALPLLAVGVPLLFSGKSNRKSIGEFIFGFSFLFMGLSLLMKGLWSTVTGVTKSALAEMVGMSNDGSIRAGSAMERLKGSVAQLAGKLEQWQQDGTLSRLGEQLDQGLARGLDLASRGFQWLGNTINKAKPLIISLAGAFAAVKAVKLATDLVEKGKTLYQFGKTAMLLLSAVPGAKTILAWLAVATAVSTVVIANWDNIKSATAEMCGRLKELFADVGTAIAKAFDSAKAGVAGFFTWIGDKLSSLNGAIESTPIIGGIYKGIKSAGGWVMDKLRGHALGTPYFSGGLTRINERGGEIVDLPSGTRIIPHDVSRRMAGGPSITVNVTVQGNVGGAPVRTVRVAADDQISITSMENDALRRKLESLAIETMTPIEAMNALFELKKML